MAEYIKIKTDLLSHPKTLKLKKKLGADGFFSLIALWIYVARYHPDGDISDMSPEDIAAVSMWNKDPEQFLETLIEVGFVDEILNPDGSKTIKIHNWEKHNPHIVKAPIRSEIARNLALRRWNKKNKNTDANGNANSYFNYANGNANGTHEKILSKINDLQNCEGCKEGNANGIADGNAGGIFPRKINDLQDEAFKGSEYKEKEKEKEKVKQKEKEKEKENYNKHNSNNINLFDINNKAIKEKEDLELKDLDNDKDLECLKYLEDDKEKEKEKEIIISAICEKKVVSKFPVVVFDEESMSFKGVEHYIEKWKEAYSLIDIEKEIKKAESWVISQPRSKWKKDWKRFLTNWLAKAEMWAERRRARNPNIVSPEEFLRELNLKEGSYDK